MVGYIIITVVIIFGGLLALLGDRVGMKVGKKRLSLFGMRPKYTSMVITVLTGFFIVGLTLIILSFISDYVHTAIFRLKAIQEELAVTTNQVRSLTEQYNQKEEEYNSLTKKHLQLLRDLETVVAERRKKEEQLIKIEEEYRSARMNLDTTTKELALAQKRSKNLAKINEDLQNQITNLNLQEARLTQQIQNLEGWLKSLEDRHQTIVGKPIIFYVGEILLAKVIEPIKSTNKSFDQIIEPLLNEANQIALKRGAKIPGKSDYALRISPQRIAEINKEIAKLNSLAVLRVTVEKNSVANEPLTVSLEVYPNQRIFARGETIAETSVLSSASESDLRDQLLSLLIVAINKAIEKGIITDGQNLRNVISISEIANIINKIKANDQNLNSISVIASDHIFRTDPFKVKLTLKDLKGSESK
ncbi:MAG: DUF3084 domain-containing protein [Firmicutes bacterium]|nr:DUF3084 domain-containing protein [Bacillota bacterium]